MAPVSKTGRLLAGGYVLLVLAVTLFVVATNVFIEGDGTANMSAIWLLVVTLPWSMFLTAVHRPGHELPFAVFVVGLVVAAAINTWLLARVGSRH